MYFPAPGPRPMVLVPKLYLPALVPIWIYRCWPTILLPMRGVSLHIPTLSPQFVFAFTALAHKLYYRPGAWIFIYLIIGSSSSGSSISRSSNFFGKDNTNANYRKLGKKLKCARTQAAYRFSVESNEYVRSFYKKQGVA